MAPKGSWSTSFFGFWNDLDACAQTAEYASIDPPNAFDAMDNSYYRSPAGTPARDSVLFAKFATVITSSDQLSSVCALTTGPAMFTSCMQSLLPASDVFTTLLKAPLEALRPQLAQTSQAIAGLNVSFVQWATIAGVDQVLHQPMITSSSTSSSWSFIGWMTMFDWANDQREVYSFQGDLNTNVLMSRPHPFEVMAMNPVELPYNACPYFWVVCITGTEKQHFRDCPTALTQENSTTSNNMPIVK
ncbi:hypothetical protein DYB25_002184 [Aphanomyces astaci]|uniref:Uncharacterized protein n=1 Tax=Aphanomyces astaci TaxID=112090 RepID=A0A397B373_APHAT|nr:hypothetical protein DYB25_002184 [Aphanomyces astaci]